MRTRGFSLPDLAITLTFLILFGWVIWQTQMWRWPFRAALFPTIIATIMLALVVLKLVLDTLNSRRQATPEPVPLIAATTVEATGQSVALVEEDEAAEAELEDIFATAPSPVWRQAIGWMAAFFVMVWVFGMMITVPLFALVYLTVAGREKPLVAIIYALVSWIFVFGLFDRVLNIPLPESIFKSLLFPVAG